MRGCIGRPFAWQEALIVVAILLQNFKFQMEDPSYSLRIKQTLTIKPKGFELRATLREGISPTNLEGLLNNAGQAPAKASYATNRDRKPAAPRSGEGKPMHVYYGSNTGTCEAFASRLAADAVGYGYSAEMKSLDSAMENMPRNEPVVIITASYEGQPPDNAAHFFEWLNGLKGKEIEGVNYAVFGCGHRKWCRSIPFPPFYSDLT
jgi:cytochrome P450/NADPH-cytochrome P450 reductase